MRDDIFPFYTSVNCWNLWFNAHKKLNLGSSILALSSWLANVSYQTLTLCSSLLIQHKNVLVDPVRSSLRSYFPKMSKNSIDFVWIFKDLFFSPPPSDSFSIFFPLVANGCLETPDGLNEVLFQTDFRTWCSLLFPCSSHLNFALDVPINLIKCSCMKLWSSLVFGVAC